jgi:hypothetical protein
MLLHSDFLVRGRPGLLGPYRRSGMLSDLAGYLAAENGRTLAAALFGGFSAPGRPGGGAVFDSLSARPQPVVVRGAVWAIASGGGVQAAAELLEFGASPAGRINPSGDYRLRPCSGFGAGR